MQARQASHDMTVHCLKAAHLEVNDIDGIAQSCWGMLCAAREVKVLSTNALYKHAKS